MEEIQHENESYNKFIKASKTLLRNFPEDRVFASYYVAFDRYYKCHASTIPEVAINFLTKMSGTLEVIANQNFDINDKITVQKDDVLQIEYNPREKKYYAMFVDHAGSGFFHIDFEKQINKLDSSTEKLRLFTSLTKNFTAYVHETYDGRVGANYLGRMSIKLDQHVSQFAKMLMDNFTGSTAEQFKIFLGLTSQEFLMFSDWAAQLFHDKQIDNEYFDWMYKIFKKNPESYTPQNITYTSDWREKFYEFIIFKIENYDLGAL